MTKEVIISAKSLKKSYGKKKAKFDALRGIDLEIYDGEALAIVGKSGSGKSTLMHLLALLDTPTSGHIKLRDQNTSKLRARKLNKIRNQEFGFVFQSFFMNAHETVIQNVMSPLKIAGVSTLKRRKLAMQALKSVNLADKAKNKAMNLSGGQKQRVCIARAIVNQPKIIFADEPTGNLDSTTGTTVENLLFKLNREKGITLIIVTHDEELANKCDRKVYIKDGKIVEIKATKGAKK